MSSSLSSEEILKRIRYDPETKRGSVLDVVQLVTGCDQAHMSRTLTSILERFPDLNSLMPIHKFPGRGQRDTPVAPLPVLVKVIMLCPGKTALKWRLNAAEVLCRALGGDSSLCAEIQEQGRLVAGTLTAEMAQGEWTSLQQMDFSVEESDEDPAGLVYLAGSPQFGLVKVGSWAGEEAALLSRYRTYYGPQAWVRTWRSEDRRRDEAAALFALKEHSAGGELIEAAAAEKAAQLLTANLPEML